MRHAILLLTLTVMALTLASGVAIAQVVTCPTGANGICVGTDNDDTLNGTASADDMRGLKGQDTLNAAADFDLLNGGRGNDTLNGEADSDTLSGDLGDDALKGGAQDDTYLFADGWGEDRITDDAAMGMFGERLSFSLLTQPVRMDLISSTARPEVQSGSNTLNFGPNVVINEVDGGSSNDDIKGDEGNDFLNGIQGNDTVRGRAGADTVVGMDGKDGLFGGSGIDEFDAGNGADVIHAADEKAEIVSCGGGNDTVYYDQGDDTLSACEDKRAR